MIVILPSILDKDTIGEVVSNSVDEKLRPIAEEITYDFNYLNFIKPAGVTLLSNLVEWLYSKGVKVKVKNHKSKKDCIKFLDDSMFFDRYLGKVLFDNSKVRPTTIPLMIVKYSESHSWIETRFKPWLINQLNLFNSTQLTEIFISIEEIFNNIEDHATESIGCVFAQHYPQRNEIIITISDFGVGIPYHVKKLVPEISDSQAILMATQHGFSTKSTPKNRGAGLDTLIQNVVSSRQGSVYIRSNYGIINCINENGKLIKLIKEDVDFYPGTFIEITLNKRNFNPFEDEFEEEFEW